jgi:soluble lytic murein transglycosylase-like protein
MKWLLAVLPFAAAQAQTTTSTDLMRAAMEQQRAAVSLQREAVRKQANAIGRRPALIAQSAPQVAGCDPISEPELTPLVETASRRNGLEPRLLRAVIDQESGARPCSVSPKGAVGLMQLMPGTADDLGVLDPFDAVENISAGARFLKQLIERYKGDLGQALGAYNAGPATVDHAGGIPDIPETRGYVDAIMRKLGN